MLSLWLPIVVTTIALFFCSFLSWMVLGLHEKDWNKIENEDELIDKIREMNVPVGSYMIPGTESNKDMQSEAYQQKYKAGPRGIITLLPEANMGKNLALTVLYFFCCSCTFAYLANFALEPGSEPGADFVTVFRFVATIALLAFIASITQHAIWFRTRIVGHLIESIAYCLIAGAIFATFWP